jgi:hypothetical protein
MGRIFDGGYAEYVVVPRRQVIPFSSALPWAVLGAVPETLQTAYGSLNIGLDLQSGQTLLIRGGTSALGLAAATLAKDRGATVLATTRQPERAAALHAHGVDHVFVDNGQIASAVRVIVPRAGGHSAGSSACQSPNEFADGVHAAAYPKTALWLSDLQALRLQWVDLAHSRHRPARSRCALSRPSCRRSPSPLLPTLRPTLLRPRVKSAAAHRSTTAPPPPQTLPPDVSSHPPRGANRAAARPPARRRP